MKRYWATFERSELRLPRNEADSASHPGPCDSDVQYLLTVPHITAQLDSIEPRRNRDELREYGGWDDSELADETANRARIVWIAACDIAEELRQKARR